MLVLNKIAVTGGLASGKSTVCQFFKEQGAYVVSADEIVHHLLSSDASVIRAILDLLGPDVSEKDQINHAAIAQKVFKNPDLLHSLEAILHPEVKKEIDRQYQQVKQEGKAPLFVAEIPVLFESDVFDSSFDAIIVVAAKEEICRSRYKSKMGKSGEEFSARASHQLPLSQKMAQADFVIYNDKGLDELKQEVKKTYQILTS